MKRWVALTTVAGVLFGLSALYLQARELCEAIARTNCSATSQLLQTAVGSSVCDAQTGFTPLHVSARRGDIDSVRMLLKPGAKADVRSHDGSTPLLLATRAAHTGVVQLLRCSGADPNAENAKGETPLGVAVTAERDDLQGILREPECVSPLLLDALEDRPHNNIENVGVLFNKLKGIYGTDKSSVYTGTLLQEVFLKIANSGRQDLIRFLIDALSAPNLRLEASLALHRYPARVAVPVLISALDNSNPDVQLRLLEAIAALDPNAAKPYLQRSLHDTDHAVRAYAQALIQQSTILKAGELQGPVNAGGDAKLELVLQMGHQGVIQSVTFTPDERYVLTGSDDRTAMLWDLTSGMVVRRFEGHSFSVEGVDISPDGSYLATASESGVVLSGLRTDRVVRIPAARARSVSFSADSKYLAVAASVGTKDVIQVWDIETAASAPELTIDSSTRSVQFSPIDQLILAVRPKEVAILEVVAGSAVQRFVASDESFLKASFSRSGLYVFTVGPRTARIWDVRSGKEVRRFYRDFYDIPNRFIDTASCGSLTARSFTVSERIRLLEVLAGRYKGFTSAALSPHSDLLVTGSWDSTAQIWDVQTGKLVRSLPGHDKYVSAASFSPTGKYVSTGSADFTAVIWEAGSGRPLRRLEGAASSVTTTAYSERDGLVVTGDNSGMLNTWSVKKGSQVARFRAHDSPVKEVVIATDYLTTAGCDDTVRMWDRGSFAEKGRFDGNEYKATVLTLGTPGTNFVTSEWNGIVGMRGFQNETAMIPVSGRGIYADGAALSASGKRLLTWTDHRRDDPFKGPEATVWDVTAQKPSGQLLWHSLLAHGIDALHDPITFATFSQSEKKIVTGTFGGNVILWDANTGAATDIFSGREQYAVDAGLFLSGTNPQVLLTGGFDATAHLWNTSKPTQPMEFIGHSNGISSLSLISREQFLLSGSYDGTVRIWNLAKGEELLRLISLRDGTWIVINREGRFDANNLESIKGLSWVFPDQPFRLLGPEIFMRDYYEPRLLPRLLAGEELPKMRSLGDLNRVQPRVEVKAEWQDEGTGKARVVVTVKANSDPTMRNGKTYTKPYDVRVFRDGQLVGWAPKTSVEWQLEPPPTGANRAKIDELDLQLWREKTEVRDLGTDGTKELPPFFVQVPRRADLKQVTFTAYAFNEDRVKSATVSATLKVEQELTPRTGKAYIISVGVNRTESSPAWDLQYAANDARQMVDVVGNKLEDTKQFAQVVPIRLVSDQKGKEQPGEAAATKTHVQAVIDVLAGRRAVDEQLRREIPNIEKVEKAQPEDLALLMFSSHGYTDDRGVFHMVLADIGPNTPQDRITTELQRKSLSSNELSGWLRKVDAGEMVMVVDSCHSAATVEAEGFKPGPMGSRGLGQLAYDKGMRILAASKSEQSAGERDGIKHGLLSYALLEEGLKQGLADFQPKDGKILMSEWLAYGEQEVPKLFQEGDAKGAIQRKGGPDTTKDGYHGSNQTPVQYQQPVLFDFSKNQNEVVLVRRSQ